jgi:hypothetical protein
MLTRAERSSGTDSARPSPEARLHLLRLTRRLRYRAWGSADALRLPPGEGTEVQPRSLQLFGAPKRCPNEAQIHHALITPE